MHSDLGCRATSDVWRPGGGLVWAVVDAWWAQVLGMQVHPWLDPLVLLLQVLVGLGIVAIVLRVRLSRRWAPMIVIASWLAFVGTWWLMSSGDAAIANGLLAVAVTGFWLIDRGIPGNRRRPPWFKLYATCLVGLAVVSVTLVSSALPGVS